MKRVTPYPVMPPVKGEAWDGALLRLLREYSDSINQAADHRLSEFVSVVADYTAGENDHIILCSPTGAMTVTIPAASVMRNKRIIVKRATGTSHVITIQSASGTIDGSANTTLTQFYESKEFFSNGVAWFWISEKNGFVGWSDLTSSTSTAGIVGAVAPVAQPFGPGTPLRKEYAFAVGDYVYLQPFHVNHDIVPVTCQAYLHVHWSTNGTNTAVVRWEFLVSRAKGHNQAAFGNQVSIVVEQAASGTAWKHMITEVTAEADILTLTEPDELINVTLRRVTNGGTDNTDQVFGLTVDLHYQTDRMSSVNRSPNFYA